MKNPIGSFCKTGQFTREFLCFGYLESTTVRMPSGIKKIANFFRVFKRYCDREPIGVNDEPETNLSRANYQLGPFVHS